MRYENFSENEHYYVYGKGSGQEALFPDDRDKARFLFLITHFQSPTRIYNVSWYTEAFIKKNSFSTQDKRARDILKKRSVELVAFSLMPGRFNLLVKNLEEGILSVYMQRVLTAYSKYFNSKYNKKGHVFEGPFKALRARNVNHLLELSAFIHKSPQSIEEWKETYLDYPYSSCQDYIGTNRWEDFLSTGAILKHFKEKPGYRKFVEAYFQQSLNNL